MGTISVMLCAFQMKRFSYMKHAFIIQFLTPLFLLFTTFFLGILFCCCGSNRSKLTERQETPESTAGTHMRKKSQECMNHRYEVIVHDSLAPVGTLLFNINDVGAICNDSRGELYISGFATDGEDHFYFATGNPVVIKVYHRNALTWQRVVSKCESVHGLFKLLGDSLFLFEEMPAQILRIPTSGTGAIDTLQLPLQRITGGRCFENQYFLWDSVEWKEDATGRRRYCTLRTFEYPNHLLKEKTYSTIHDFPSKIKREMDLADQLAGFRVGDCIYVGSVGGYHIYTARFYGDCTIIIVSENERLIHLYPVLYMPTLNVCVSHTESLPIINRDYDILCNGNLYILGYNRHPTDIILSQIDIHHLIQQLTTYGAR